MSASVNEIFGDVAGKMVPLCPHCDLRDREAKCECQLRSCADCSGYVPERSMTTMPDSRKVCKGCGKSAREGAIKRSQSEMFRTVQERLF